MKLKNENLEAFTTTELSDLINDITSSQEITVTEEEAQDALVEMVYLAQLKSNQSLFNLESYSMPVAETHFKEKRVKVNLWQKLKMKICPLIDEDTERKKNAEITVDAIGNNQRVNFNNLQKINNMKYIKVLGLFILITLMQIPSGFSQNKKKEMKLLKLRQYITPAEAALVMRKDLGTKAPERKLYHTYEEKYSVYKSSPDGSYTYNSTYILSFSKIEENYVEGTLIKSTNEGNSSYPIFGRYDFNRLYIYTLGTATSPNKYLSYEYLYTKSLYPQEIFVFEIGQNGRILTRSKYAYYTLYGQIEWLKESSYNINLATFKPWKNVIEHSSTGFISKTDNYIGEEGKSRNGNTQTLTEKLKELKSLYEQGAISEAEYNKAKKKALEN